MNHRGAPWEQSPELPMLPEELPPLRNRYNLDEYLYLFLNSTGSKGLSISFSY